VGSGEIVVGIGMARYLDPDIALELAPGHPSQHGALQLRLTLDADVIVAAEPQVGLLHRSTEKLFEARDYRQLMMLANRHDWLSSFSSELAIALVLETAMGITPPDRATYSRMLLAELNRISAALLLVGTAIGDEPALALRARCTDLQESATGNRVHPMVNRIGGLCVGLFPQWLGQLARLADDLDAQAAGITERAGQAFAPLAGIAVLSRADALATGATGPVAQASGIDLDIRRHQPYLRYAEIGLPDHAIQAGGDIPSRYEALLAQLPGSIAVMRSCALRLDELGDTPVDVPLPKVVRAPEGILHGEIEGPLGVIGILLASAADKAPLRLKLRTPSFSNVQAMACALPGVAVEHLAAAVMSFFLMSGDIDR